MSSRQLQSSSSHDSQLPITWINLFPLTFPQLNPIKRQKQYLINHQSSKKQKA